jgi:hypothetical protein
MARSAGLTFFYKARLRGSGEGLAIATNGGILAALLHEAGHRRSGQRLAVLSHCLGGARWASLSESRAHGEHGKQRSSRYAGHGTVLLQFRGSYGHNLG